MNANDELQEPPACTPAGTVQLFRLGDSAGGPCRIACGAVGLRAARMGSISKRASDLARSGHMPEFEPIDLAGWDLALATVRGVRLTYGTEWSAGMWRAATLALLEVMDVLSRDHLALEIQDTAEVQFLGARPVWVNPAAIAPLTDGALARSLARLRTLFLLPLALCVSGRSGQLRRLMRTFAPLTDLDISGGGEWLSAADELISKHQPLRAIRPLHQLVSSARAPQGTSPWEGYYGAGGVKEYSDPKAKAVSAALAKLHPATVLDVGCNVGRFSFLAHGSGASVVGIDSDEPCIESLFQDASVSSADITPLVVNLRDPPPALGPFYTRRASAIDRLRCEAALALAVSHHLLLSGGTFGLDSLAKLYASLCERVLLTEFVPFGADARNPYSPNFRPGSDRWYNLDAFCEALQPYFRVSKLETGYPTGRHLLLCLKE